MSMADDDCGSSSPEERANRTRILLANSPRSYREAMGAALRVLRPALDVVVAPPDWLDEQLEHTSFDIVVCNHVTPLVEEEATIWIDLYPNGERLAIIGEDGRISAVPELDLADLLSIIDRAGVRQDRVR
jgi:hypothetical protein